MAWRGGKAERAACRMSAFARFDRLSSDVASCVIRARSVSPRLWATLQNARSRVGLTSQVGPGQSRD
eukprot:1300649-Alexandrium_andersonii.AAC.1